MTRVRSRIGSSVALLAFTSFALVSACTDSSPSADREATVIGVIVRGLVPTRGDETTVTRDVFIGNRDDPFSAELQADVVQELHNYESVRFVDDRSEAIGDEAPRPVHSDGVYLEIGPIPMVGTRITVPVLRYVDQDKQAHLLVKLKRSAGVWTVIAIDEE